MHTVAMTDILRITRKKSSRILFSPMLIHIQLNTNQSRTLGDEAKTCWLHPSSYCWKFSLNICARRLATLSYLCLSDHVSRGWRISLGTPSHSRGTEKPNLSSSTNTTSSKSPRSAAFRRARVQRILILFDSPYPPATHPVLISQQLAFCSLIFFESKSA